MSVWALSKAHIQPVAFLQLSFLHSNDKDPMCIVDIGISKDVRSTSHSCFHGRPDCPAKSNDWPC